MNHQIAQLLVGLAVVGTALAASSGNVALCDPSGNYGCNSWQNNDRLQNCLDPNPGEMPWVRRPRRTGTYTVRTGESENQGEDPTTYAPGTVIPIFVSVTQQNRKYRGLLLHAEDSSGKAVGDWNAPLKSNPLFWVPPRCPKAVLHVDAEEKPYEVEIQFKTPPKGTGTITLKALFKEGPANTGEFYYPQKDVVLTEAAELSPQADAPIWVMSKAGASCADTCSSMGRSCDAAKLAQVDSAGKFLEVMAQTQGVASSCALPVLATCDTAGKSPVMSSDSECFYSSPLCESGSQRPKPSCDAKGSPYTQRLCSCTKPGAPSPAPPTPPPANPSPATPSPGPATTPATPSPSTILTGLFENHLYDNGGKNSWHYVSITNPAPNTYTWTNRAGATWTLTADPSNPGSLAVGEDCLYYSSGYRTAKVTMDGFKMSRILGPGNEPFDRSGDITNGLSGAASLNRASFTAARASAAAFQLSSGASGAPRGPAALPLLALVAAALSMGGGSVRSFGASSLLLLGVLGVLLCGQGAQAHNWMTSPARSVHIAQGLMPCPGRGPADTHTQVGPGQDFIIKWSSSHTPNMIHVAVVAEADLGRLANRDSKKWLDEYIDAAPAGSNIATQARFKRAWDGPPGQGTGNNLLKSVVAATDPLYMNIPSEPTDTMYAYADAAIADDRQVYYKSAKYPWIVGAARFKLLQGRPDNSDMVRLKIPDNAPVGHYVANWRFQGYYDCVDIDKMPQTVANVYGVDSGTFQFDRVDHCQFPSARNISAPCVLAPNGNLEVTERSLVDNFNPKPSDDNRVQNGLRNIGYTMVRANSPALAKFSNGAREGGVPVKDGTCVSGGALNMGGADSLSTTPWAAWRNGARSALVEGKRCATARTIRTTLREAVLRCTPASCTGLSWQSGPNPDMRSVFSGTHTFRLCSSDPAAETNAQYTSFVKKPRALQPLTGTFTASFNFAPAGQAVSGKPAGMITDTGAPFGSRNGRQYGWTTNCGPPDIKRRGNGGGTTVNDFGVSDIEVCKGNPAIRTLDRAWEVAVPNGVYEVDVVTAQANRGCYLEGTRLNNGGWDENARSPQTLTVRVGVTDGRLTLSGLMNGGTLPFRDTLGAGCWWIMSLSLTKVADALPTAWLPPTANPWWQRDLRSSRSVGVVQITPPDGFATTCRQRWLFQGISCNDEVPAKYNNNPSFTQGQFDPMGNRNDVGLVVRVSDTPCTNGGGDCPGTICEKVTEVWLTEDSRPNHHLAPITVDCAGKRGRYVTVQLPGQERILSFASITVNGETVDEVKLPSNMHIAWGVEARTPTSVNPAFKVSLDPLDPIFYSTCFIRRRVVTFLPTAPPQPPQPRFRFNRHCLSCANFLENTALITTNPVAQAPFWDIDPACFDCRSSAPAFTGLFGGSPAVAAVAVGGSAIVFIGLLVVAVFVVRRLRSGPGGAQAVSKQDTDWMNQSAAANEL